VNAKFIRQASTLSVMLWKNHVTCGLAIASLIGISSVPAAANRAFSARSALPSSPS
jgi:hypothetical protein